MITFSQAQQSSAGNWLRPPAHENTPLHGGAFDTRQLGEAQIFYALQGDQNDGHRYLPNLYRSSVKLAVISNPQADLGAFAGAVLVVNHVHTALNQMAQWLVAHYQPKVVAITGSYGKTTSKETIAHVLSEDWRVLKSQGTHNNEIGIPLTLLKLSTQTQVAVLEYSARKVGDIAHLCRIAPPDIGVLTAVGSAHIGVFGSQQAILNTKGELFTHLAPGGLAIFNGDDPRLAALATNKACMAFYGGNTALSNPKTLAPNAFYAQNLRADSQGKVRFEGVHQNVRIPMQSNLMGPHGAEPILAAWAVAKALGAPTDAVVAKAASRVMPLYGRATPTKTKQGAFVLDDSYNASPETIANLIQTLNLRPEANKVLVLGPLSELEQGWEHTSQHIAKAITPSLSAFYVYEPQPNGLAECLKPLIKTLELRVFYQWDALLDALLEWDNPQSVFGVKGGRSAHLERLVLALQGEVVGCRRHPCPLLVRCDTCAYLSKP